VHILLTFRLSSGSFRIVINLQTAKAIGYELPAGPPAPRRQGDGASLHATNRHVRSTSAFAAKSGLDSYFLPILRPSALRKRGLGTDRAMEVWYHLSIA